MTLLKVCYFSVSVVINAWSVFFFFERAPTFVSRFCHGYFGFLHELMVYMKLMNAFSEFHCVQTRPQVLFENFQTTFVATESAPLKNWKERSSSIPPQKLDHGQENNWVNWVYWLLSDFQICCLVHALSNGFFVRCLYKLLLLHSHSS